MNSFAAGFVTAWILITFLDLILKRWPIRMYRTRGHMRRAQTASKIAADERAAHQVALAEQLAYFEDLVRADAATGAQVGEIARVRTILADALRR